MVLDTSGHQVAARLTSSSYGLLWSPSYCMCHTEGEKKMSLLLDLREVTLKKIFASPLHFDLKTLPPLVCTLNQFSTGLPLPIWQNSHAYNTCHLRNICNFSMSLEEFVITLEPLYKDNPEIRTPLIRTLLWVPAIYRNTPEMWTPH